MPNPFHNRTEKKIERLIVPFGYACISENDIGDIQQALRVKRNISLGFCSKRAFNGCRCAAGYVVKCHFQSQAAVFYDIAFKLHFAVIMDKFTACLIRSFQGRGTDVGGNVVNFKFVLVFQIFIAQGRFVDADVIKRNFDIAGFCIAVLPDTVPV